MKIERLTYIVQPDSLDKFLKAENEVWTAWLRQQKGFLSKQMTPYPGSRVEIQIFWKSEEDMQRAAKKPDITAVEARFNALLGNTFRLVYSG